MFPTSSFIHILSDHRNSPMIQTDSPALNVSGTIVAHGRLGIVCPHRYEVRTCSYSTVGGLGLAHRPDVNVTAGYSAGGCRRAR
ncbi:hypothetical protein M404DRAFT_635630 [Pisolithus tinctorius Marx 270]|uniref:Uncharacterized protein n=1 Tax=Pisolithus tinctorius Marx 270 TaxID=870435 RepID=A0A0C3J242_PISTI|nr:hypothetical protein M404DRAFT_635630 [Pisolithus tinctorius Marx 270]